MKQPRVVAGVAAAAALALLLSGCTDSPITATTASTASTEAPPVAITGWHSLPDVPLTPRTEPVVAWTGNDLLVVGGIPGPPCPPTAYCTMSESSRDGASYNPESKTWTELPGAPVGIAAASAVVIDGTLFATHTKYSAPTQLLSYDITTSTWAVHEVPDDLWRTPVADGDRLVLVAGSDEAGEAEDLIFEIASGAWSALPADPLGPSFDRVITAIPDGLVLTATPLVDSPGADTPSLVSVARYDGRTNEWTRLPDIDQLSSGTTWMLAGEDLVTVQLGGAASDWGRTYPYGGMLSLSEGTWSPLIDVPEPDRNAWLRATAVSNRFAISDGYVYDHALRSWTTLGRPSDAPTEAGRAVWADEALMVIGGVDWAQLDGDISAKAWVYLPATESGDL